MKRLLLLFALTLVAVGCDWKSTGETEPDKPATSPPPTRTNAATTGAEPKRTAVIPPDVYGRLVDQTLLKRQRDVTVCTLDWSKQFPERELPVEVVFELDARGGVTRVEARTLTEAEKIGRCIEAAIAPAKFPPGGPDQTFRKRMIFNPQDKVVEKSKLKDVADPGSTNAGSE